MLQIKSGRYGCRLNPVAAVVVLFIVVSQCMEKHALAYEATSALEGTHSPGSLHYVGLAYDFTVRSGADGPTDAKILDARFLAMVKDVTKNLGDDFDLVSYFPKERRIHVEFQPKLPLGKL